MGLFKRMRYPTLFGRKPAAEDAAHGFIHTPSGDLDIENPSWTKNIYCPNCHISRALPLGLAEGASFVLQPCLICHTIVTGQFKRGQVHMEY